MGRALIIGCGGVAGVVIHKCCQNSDVFDGDHASPARTKSKCDAIKAEAGRYDRNQDPHRQGGCGQRG